MMDKSYDVPSDVTVEDGEVMVDGPGGIAVSFTPRAAEETSHRLLDGAARAAGQASRKKVRVEERGRRHG